jgi:hypothetical protein
MMEVREAAKKISSAPGTGAEEVGMRPVVAICRRGNDSQASESASLLFV